MGSLAGALLAELSDSDLDALAERLASRLRAGEDAPSAWLDVGQAAAHIAAPKSRVYALVSAGRIPFEKDGSRLLFDRGALDEWVRAGGARRP